MGELAHPMSSALHRKRPKFISKWEHENCLFLYNTSEVEDVSLEEYIQNFNINVNDRYNGPNYNDGHEGGSGTFCFLISVKLLSNNG